MERTWTDEIKWCAGFFDGEGHVRVDQHRGGATKVARIDITQADRRVLDRFQRAVGLGKVYGPYDRRYAHQRDRYEYVAIYFERVQAIIAMLWQWLDEIKRDQARTALLAARAAFAVAPGRSRDRDTCKRGHSLADPTNVHIYYQKGYESRECRACRRLAMAHTRLVAKTAQALLTA